MGIFPAVHFTSDKKNSQLFTFTGITRGISASKRRTMGTVYSHKPFFMYTNTQTQGLGQIKLTKHQALEGKSNARSIVYQISHQPHISRFYVLYYFTVLSVANQTIIYFMSVQGTRESVKDDLILQDFPSRSK